MAVARQDADWTPTAHILAMMRNVNRAKDSDKVWQPADFPRVIKTGQRLERMSDADRAEARRRADAGRSARRK